ncbi:MAG: hypothetical protein AAB276_08560, partial [Pseudomonadota bacterium]
MTIESIAVGQVLPCRMILWLDDEQRFNARPVALRRLEARGLEVRLSENFGPHTKYYPYVAQAQANGPPLVTADDDMLYPRDWLAALVHAYAANPHLIHCWRARVLQLASQGLQ